jgi:hypothetical protein
MRLDRAAPGVAESQRSLKSRTGTFSEAMSTSKKPLEPDDFTVTAEGQKIKKQDGEPIATTEDHETAADLAQRITDDEARRDEDKWSA